MNAPTFIDIFSGAGLFSGGLVQVGMSPILAVDVDASAIQSYNRNIRPCGVVGSVVDFGPIPTADVLIAGPPCQGFSTLGRQDPLDVRNSLSRSVPRWAEKSDCSVAIIENVPPFLQSSFWQAMADDLLALGFEISTWELEAADYGTPQRRRRAFTIASKLGLPTLPPKSAKQVPASAALNRPIRPSDPMHTWPEPSALAAARFDLVPPKGDKRDILRLQPDLCPPSWARVGCNATDVWGRVDPDAPSNTIRCTFQNPSKGRYIHPSKGRVLSLREGARLQGVPDDWIFSGRPYPVARQIGNGVPVPLAAAVGRQILELFSVDSRLAA